jgi:hypothetical protein
MDRALVRLVLILSAICGTLVAKDNEYTPRGDEKGLHFMVFQSRSKQTPDASQPRCVSLPSDFPAKITYLMTGAGARYRLQYRELADINQIALLDVFLFYPNKSETRERKRKPRKHDNSVVDGELEIRVRDWSETGYSLELQGKYNARFKEVNLEGNWGETRVALVPATKDKAVLIAATPAACLGQVVAGLGCRAAPPQDEAKPPAVKDPVLTEKTSPTYPPGLAEAGRSSVVALLVVINKEGRITPDHTLILYTPHALFAASALTEVVQNWRFRPAQVEGKPIDLVAILEVTFRLR